MTEGVLDVWTALASDLERSADLLDPRGEARERAGTPDSVVVTMPRRPESRSIARSDAEK